MTNTKNVFGDYQGALAELEKETLWCLTGP